jgi:hypothetical protein
MKSRHVAAAGLGAVVLASALAGCSSASSASQSRAAVTGSPAAPSVAAATPTATATPNPSWAPTQLPLSGVVATATLTSSDGRTTGQVALITTGSTLTATLSNLHTGAAGRLDATLSTATPAMTCPADRPSLPMSGIDGDPDAWTLRIVNDQPLTLDPTFLRTIVLVPDSAIGKPSADGCRTPTLAIGKLTWKVPASPAFPVTDQGARPHAIGKVSVVGGKPSTYTVAPNDDLEAIRARFGLSMEQFDYLNPFDTSTNDGNLTYGTVFNLSAKERGLPTS